MEKVNVYDWDKTIFPVDSTVAFYKFCLKHYPGVLSAAPRTVAMLPGYWAKRCTKTRIKEQFYGFLRYVAFLTGWSARTNSKLTRRKEFRHRKRRVICRKTSTSTI